MSAKIITKELVQKRIHDGIFPYVSEGELLDPIAAQFIVFDLNFRMTKGALAEVRLGNLIAYDTAIPQQWLDKQVENLRGDERNYRYDHILSRTVWIYPKGVLSGMPFDLFTDHIPS